MSTLSFFPWLTIREPVSLPPFSLVPYERARRPGGVLQGTLDVVLEPHVDTVKPIRRATLIHFEGRPIVDDLTEVEIAQFYRFRDLIALAGLASRECFGFGLHYCNRDNFVLAIQSFNPAHPASAVSRVSRRRDGSARGIVARSAYLERRPAHVPANVSDRVDMPLLQALLNGQRSLSHWARCEDAIRFFNDANSDDEQVLEQAEAVYMVSAFERLLDCRRGKEDDLVGRFSKAWRPRECLVARIGPRAGAPISGRMSLTEAWLRDFFRHRGSYAHGKLTALHPPVWSLREHLLLGSYLFPRLVKRILDVAGLYVWTDKDEDDAGLFEHFLNEDLFSAPEDPEDGTQYAWDRVRQDYLWRRVHAVISG